MKKVHKIIIGISSGVLVVALAGFIASYFTFLHRYKGHDLDNPWNASDAFDINAIKTVQKQKGKDFVILNFADVQMCDLEDLGHANTIHKELTYLVETYKPDLITLTGDQVWSNENLVSLTSLIRWLDEYKVPYCPVFGNHDFGNDFDSAVSGQKYSCELYEKGKYSLFSRGPNNLGNLGNYVVNVVEGEKIVHSLYFMDLGYMSEVTTQQVEWFKWNADGIRAANEDEHPQSTVFTHKDLPNFYRAYSYSFDDPEAAEGKVIRHMAFSYVDDNGFVEAARSHGVYDFVAGHQHYNNFTIRYDDARCTFAVKTGECVSYYEDEEIYLNGATTITLGDDLPVIEHHYVEKGTYS